MAEEDTECLKKIRRNKQTPEKTTRLENINDRDDLLLDLGSQSLSYACARYYE